MSSRLQALERAGLRCRELEDQLKVRQESLRTVQAESVVLETQLEATQTEQEQLQLNLRKADASNAVLAQRLSSVERQQREAASISPRLQQSEATKGNICNLEAQLHAERAARQVQLERVASALRASTQEEAEARARFEQAIVSDAQQMSEVAHCATRRAVSAEADVVEQSVPPYAHMPCRAHAMAFFMHGPHPSLGAGGRAPTRVVRAGACA